MKAKRHLVTRNQLSDWPAIIYSSSDQLPVFCLRAFYLEFDNSLLKRTISVLLYELKQGEHCLLS